MNGLISRLIYPGASRSVDVGQVERTLQPGEEACVAGDHPRRTYRVDHPSTG